ncbi:MAG TPA: hypothetical protein VGG05_07645 [Pseudonocardiaceae bacterium]|jgi:hypothetical protein
MTPTLFGRIQTRIFLLAVVGGVVTAWLTPLLPMTGPAGDRYRATFVVLAAVAVLGIGWEIIYHVLMQWRWEKDWPTLFGLLTGVTEGLLLWVLVRVPVVPGLPGAVPAVPFVIDFAVIWVLVWLVSNGPMRVPFIRWRFKGGRLV